MDNLTPNFTSFCKIGLITQFWPSQCICGSWLRWGWCYMCIYL